MLGPERGRARVNGEQRLSAAGLERFERSLSTAVDGARSLDQIAAWLRSQAFVRSVKQTDYLAKSNPPQRDIIVELALEDGSTTTKAVNLYSLGEEGFRFRQLRDGG